MLAVVFIVKVVALMVNQKKALNPLQKPWSNQVKKSPIRQEKKQPKTESKVYGKNACRMVFNHRPDDIIKLYLSEKAALDFTDLMKFLAKNKKAYHLVSDQELEKIAESRHHGGIVLVVKSKTIEILETYLLKNRKEKDCLLMLDGVSNSHNLGAICRTAAHFGISGIVMTNPELLQSGAALRTAEGGIEFVNGIKCLELPIGIKLLKDNGYTLITTSSHKGTSLNNTKLPKKSVIIFGEEMFGVSKNVAKNADIELSITGTGNVESLNVSVAASLILYEWHKQNN